MKVHHDVLTQKTADELLEIVKLHLTNAVGKPVAHQISLQAGVRRTTEPDDQWETYAPNGKRLMTFTVAINPPFTSEDGRSALTPCGCGWVFGSDPSASMPVNVCEFHRAQAQRIADGLNGLLR